ncbi:hypothetical protein AXG93_4735s1060 [Marchantia polymorpha subsp. ruderalis]|uniref:dAMP1 SANT/Myb-like domain-containing protein n=1 Tax=Marchantia polymorpha subsp. ruderalis TaxID=1480154 RepID=A0A176WNG3_MARPO|nr:hypothetical protein AXG93_4735s1060 [Marchantia polymorpha subsp. ruderalis]
MADAKDILGLPKVVGSGSEKRRSTKDGQKKPDGVSREVYALTGGLPPIMPALDPSNLKKKKPVDSVKKVRVVDNVEPIGDYAFAKYNKAVDVVRYTDEEYSKYLTDTFDLRFIIIADRMPTTRTVEELKERYYSAAKAVLLSRAGLPEDVADHTLMKDIYNVQYETERKKALGILLSQSRQQEREDAEVLAEAKRIQEVRLSAKIAEEAELPSNKSAAETTVNNEMVDKSPRTPLRPTSPAQAAHAGPSTVAAAPAAPVPSVTAVGTSPAISGPRPPRVYLRSAYHAQMVQSSATQAGVRTSKRVDQLLEDYGCRAKVKNPTKTVCEEHIELRKELLTLIQLQKQRSHRGNDHERVLTRATAVGADTDSFSGERVNKREHKRKAPARFSEAPASPPHQKRAPNGGYSEGFTVLRHSSCHLSRTKRGPERQVRHQAKYWQNCPSEQSYMFFTGSTIQLLKRLLVRGDNRI